MFLKVAAWAFESGDFLNIFLRFWGFSGSFFYNYFCFKKHVHQFAVYLILVFCCKILKFQRYANTDLKICLCVCVNIKIIP